MVRWQHIARIILIAVGTSGTVLFFPVSFGDQFTCLYHRLTCEMEEESHHAGEQHVSDTRTHGSNGHEIHNASLNTYIAKFSLFWWGSIALLVIGVYYPRFAQYGQRLWQGLKHE